MILTSHIKELEQLIADQLELYRGAEQWMPFMAISNLTAQWIIQHKPTRRKLTDTLLVNPEQVFNVVMFQEKKTSMGHNRTWSQLALAHLYLNPSLIELLKRTADSRQSLDGEFCLSRLIHAQAELSHYPQDNSAALEHLRTISYSSRLPESLKKSMRNAFSLLKICKAHSNATTRSYAV